MIILSRIQLSLCVRALLKLRIFRSDPINDSTVHVSRSDKTEDTSNNVRCKPKIKSLETEGTFDSMFYDAYCCLSKQAIGSLLSSVLLVHSNSDQHIPSVNMIRAKPTLQYLRLRTLSHETAHRLAEEET
jgi:hypothetical protein